jgi:hypothetical protein
MCIRVCPWLIERFVVVCVYLCVFVANKISAFKLPGFPAFQLF